MAGQLISDASGYNATEFDTKIPSLNDQANIVEAFKLYHYGIDSYDGTQPPAGDSVHAHLADINNRLELVEIEDYVHTITGTPNEVNVSASTGSITVGLPNSVLITTNLTVGSDLNVGGNLIVSGSTSTINTSNLNVEDSLLYLGADNPGNVLDLGLVASFTSASYQHTGLVRDASDNTWKLFSGVFDEPGTTINFGQAVYDTLKLGSLEATANIAAVNITATGVSDIRIPANTRTASYEIALSDVGKIVEMNVASGNNITIPPNSTAAIPVGSQVTVLQIGSGQTTIVAGSGVTANGTPGLKLRAQWSAATLVKRATDTWVVLGDLAV
jgi:hypothetical protein